MNKIGTAKVKDTSDYRYKGLTLDIISIYVIHKDPNYADIYPVGSVEYRLSLKGTQWENEQTNTVIHDGQLENVRLDFPKEQIEWYQKFDKHGLQLIDEIYNYNGDLDIGQIYTKHREIVKRNQWRKAHNMDTPKTV